MALLERENFLAELQALQMQVTDGQGRLLFLGGEAGIGKSALLSEFGRLSKAAVLAGACDSLTTPRPLGPLLDMAGDARSGLSRREVTSSPRDEVFAAFLERLKSTTEPLVVIFEDVHWADEATLDLLRFLGRRLERARALLIASFRDDEVGPDHALRVLMGDLATSRGYRRMQLTRLSLEAVRQLTADSAFDPLELHRRTGGNPFYVTEILASGESGVPVSVSDAVLARAARLSANARTVLDVAAVLGFRFDPDLVVEVLGAELGAPDATREALDECLAAGVLLAQERTMAFRHELAREAIFAVIGFARRRALHERILAVLEDLSPGDLSALAHHAEGAGDREAVLEYAPAAARAAAKARAHREAAAQLRRALRFAEGLPLAEHATLLENFAFECTWIDDVRQAEDAGREAIRLRNEVGDPNATATAMVRLSQNLLQQGRNRESDEMTEATFKLLESVPAGPAHAYARSHKAYMLMLDRRTEEAIVEGEAAIELARLSNDATSLTNAYNAVGSSLILLGDYQEGERRLRYALRLARRYRRDNNVAGAYGNLGSGLGEMYRFDDAERYLSEGASSAGSATSTLRVTTWSRGSRSSRCSAARGTRRPGSPPT